MALVLGWSRASFGWSSALVLRTGLLARPQPDYVKRAKRPVTGCLRPSLLTLVTLVTLVTLPTLTTLPTLVTLVTRVTLVALPTLVTLPTLPTPNLPRLSTQTPTLPLCCFRL